MEQINVPEKIYVNSNPENRTWLLGKSDISSIEYTRTDAFIEKACEWLKDNASNYIIEHPFSSDVDFEEDEMIENFIKYMKGE